MDKIDAALSMLYQRQIVTRTQLLTEMLRVHLTRKAYVPQNNDSLLFQVMRDTTEKELGPFPAEQGDFHDIYHALIDVDPVKFTLYIYKGDKTGTVLSPDYLNDFIAARIKKLRPKRIFIPDAEKHLAGLLNLIELNSSAEFTLTTQLEKMQMLLSLVLSDCKGVTIQHGSPYFRGGSSQGYDYIYLLPPFGEMVEEPDSFLSKSSEGAVLESQLEGLNEMGALDAIVPAKVMFSGGLQRLRSYITDKYNLKSLFVLPEGVLRPTTAIKTYFISITSKPQTEVEIGSLGLKKEKLVPLISRLIPTEDFLQQPDWRIELLLAEEDTGIRRYRSSTQPKAKLKDIASIFRGKSVLKRDTTPGNIAVLNISDIIDGVIDYTNLDTIREEESKIKQYKLEGGDVVLSSRGTAIKVAVFIEQDRPVIASANLIVIRPGGKIRGEIIKIFLESPVGNALVNSFQRGTTVMNINYQDIAELEIPLLDMEKQKEIVTRYKNSFCNYREIVTGAESRWQQEKNSIYNKLIYEY